MTELEIQLTELMVELVVRYPDGVDRIQAAFGSVIEAGAEMGTQTIH